MLSLEQIRAFPESDIIKDTLKSVFLENSLGPYSEKQYDLMAAFGTYLAAENKKYNLTSLTDPHGMALFHFADSLLFADRFPEGAAVADIGCGAGFPSIPLAIARPDLKMVCIDSTAKKIGFIDAFIINNGLRNVKTVYGRAEELFAVKEGYMRELFDVATARGVAKLGILSEICCAAVKPGGKFIALKGKNVTEELPQSSPDLNGTGLELTDMFCRNLLDNGEKTVRYAVIFRKKAPSDPKIPRIYKNISKKPLF